MLFKYRYALCKNCFFYPQEKKAEQMPAVASLRLSKACDYAALLSDFVLQTAR